MKKLVIFLIIAVVAGSMAWGATLGITVNAATKLEVTVGTASWTVSLDNSGIAIQNDAQGTVSIKSSKASYTVTFSSGNSGLLLNGSNSIAYYIKVDTSSWSTGVATNNLNSYTQLTSGKTIVFQQKTPVAGETFNIGFQVPAYTDYYVDGAYTDTVTISIAQS